MEDLVKATDVDTELKEKEALIFPIYNKVKAPIFSSTLSTMDATTAKNVGDDLLQPKVDEASLIELTVLPKFRTLSAMKEKVEFQRDNFRVL